MGTLTCHYKRAGSEAPDEVLTRFRSLARRHASGRVLDIGAYHPDDLLDYRNLCSLSLVAADARLSAQPPPAAEFVDTGLERLPFPAGAFDVVVCRFALCATPDPCRAAREIARVLGRNGHVLFLEHARAPGVIGQAQDRAQRMLHGTRHCRLNVEVVANWQLVGLVMRRLDWFWPSCYARAPLVQGVATHPDQRYRRELAWLRGTPIPGGKP